MIIRGNISINLSTVPRMIQNSNNEYSSKKKNGGVKRKQIKLSADVICRDVD